MEETFTAITIMPIKLIVSKIHDLLLKHMKATKENTKVNWGKNLFNMIKERRDSDFEWFKDSHL